MFFIDNITQFAVRNIDHASVDISKSLLAVMQKVIWNGLVKNFSDNSIYNEAIYYNLPIFRSVLNHVIQVCIYFSNTNP